MWLTTEETPVGVKNADALFVVRTTIETIRTDIDPPKRFISNKLLLRLAPAGYRWFGKVYVWYGSYLERV